jgi:hypothetical protein
MMLQFKELILPTVKVLPCALQDIVLPSLTDFAYMDLFGKKYECHQCGTTFKSESELAGHGQIHTPQTQDVLALSQILWIFWGFTDLNDVLVLANALYVTGLAHLAAALLLILRRRPSYAEVR